MGVELCCQVRDRVLGKLTVEPTLVSKIKEARQSDYELWAIQRKIRDDSESDFHVDDKAVLWFRGRLYVPKVQELKEEILVEAHNSPFSIHPGSTKMYQDLKQKFWWNGMKRDVVEFVAKCLTCQKVKIEHQRVGGLLHPLDTPIWKWENFPEE